VIEMPRVIGYGEDALTYWGLTKRLGSVLKELRDDSEPEDCLVVYRPSFGRGKIIKKPSDRKAEFGEFDAILVTPQSVYLIESKWDNLAENKKVVIDLSDIQILRHDIFAWYCGEWSFGNDWKEFVVEHEDEFEEKFGKWQRKVAPSESLLSENLKYILNLMHGKKRKNVLLYFYCKGFPRPEIRVKSGNLHFDIAVIEYPTTDESNFIKIVE